MIAQQVLPPSLPFSVLDYGLTALALISMVAISYLFTRLAREQHKIATDAFKRMTDLLEDMTRIMREVTRELQDTQLELARVREEVWRNRELINRELDQTAEALKIGMDLQQAAHGAAVTRGRAAEKHEENSKEAHQEHRDWEQERRRKEPK